MKDQTITLKGAEVEIIADAGIDAVGRAVHAVSTADLNDGTAEGPNDGEVFEIDGQKYELGAHDYEDNGDTTTCTALVYKID